MKAASARQTIACALTLVVLAPAARVLAGDRPLPTQVEFNRDVRPILSDNCFPCHGNDPNRRKAKLRLDIREEALKKEAFVPGKSEDSALVERIFATDASELMPPPKSNKKLTARQKELLKRWIAQGAVYQQHWSYEKPVKAAIPAGQNGVDVLVQKRLAEIGLKPSPQADRRTLIRRLYADLLGLPPKPEEVAEFVNDPSPDAYEKLVERVLKNPHYGERMAIGWLDVVRFADTVGYHSDNPRNVWPYRDWVIKSFNDNKRFDRFTLEQIAGDLLPDANQETRVGSAFNRLLLTTEEGGAQPKDYEQRMLTDRVRAVGAAWLGQTTGCAQCHDHKFDPFTQRDFYSLGAFFADIKEPIIGRREDGMIVSTPEQEAQLAKLEAALAQAKKDLDAVRPQLEAAQQQWLADVKTYQVTLPELRDGSTASAADVQRAKKVATALAKEPKNRKRQELDAIRDYFLNQRHQAFRDRAPCSAKGAEGTRCLLRFPAQVSREHQQPKKANRAYLAARQLDGRKRRNREARAAALPLPQQKSEGRELTRLDLARWLVARDNPLTARTVMNRLWKQFFGTGLSKVLDDLGAQGELPPNQALLDWLACEFMDSGWDMKHMVRTSSPATPTSRRPRLRRSCWRRIPTTASSPGRAPFASMRSSCATTHWRSRAC